MLPHEPVPPADNLGNLTDPFTVVVRFIASPGQPPLDPVVVPSVALDGLSREQMIVSVERALAARFGAEGVTVTLLADAPEPRFEIARQGVCVALGTLSLRDTL